MGRYLVTGAAGFIAWKVCSHLLADGHQVIGVDNLNDAYDIRLKEWRLAELQKAPRFQFHRLDITHYESLKGLFLGTLDSNHSETRGSSGETLDAVINLAARAGVRQSIETPWMYFETNVKGTLNLLQLCHEFQVKKFVMASTSSLYGANNPRPFREDADTNAPLSPYAASKKAAEALCYTYHYLHGIDVTVLRYFTVYGPAGRPDMSLFRFIQWISEGRPVVVYGDGTQERDFTYVDDIARGTVAALRPLGYEIINLGSDEPIPLMEAIHITEEVVGKKAMLEFQPRHPADVMATWADIGKAVRLLGWRPQVRFEEGVHHLAAWYRKHHDLARHIQTS